MPKKFPTNSPRLIAGSVAKYIHKSIYIQWKDYPLAEIELARGNSRGLGCKGPKEYLGTVCEIRDERIRFMFWNSRI